MNPGIFDTDPQFINDQGVKFWLDTISTSYAATKGLQGVQVAYVQFPDGKRLRLISKDGEPVFDSQSVESIGAHLDIMAMAEHFRETA